MKRGTMRFERTFSVADMTIRSDGDGRTVEALAAVFDTPVPVDDAQGRYDEVIRPGAFDRALADGGWRNVQVLYNHGLDAFGRPSSRFAMPIGTPVEIRSDSRGLVTVTRYARTALADEVLTLIQDGAIRGQSFRGQWLRSTPQSGFFRPNKAGGRQLVERHDVSLVEYGPTPFPVYAQAAIIGVRSVADLVDGLTPTERDELRKLLDDGTVVDDITEDVVEDASPGDPDPGLDSDGATPSLVEVLAAALELRKRRARS